MTVFFAGALFLAVAFWVAVDFLRGTATLFLLTFGASLTAFLADALGQIGIADPPVALNDLQYFAVKFVYSGHLLLTLPVVSHKSKEMAWAWA